VSRILTRGIYSHWTYISNFISFFSVLCGTMFSCMMLGLVYTYLYGQEYLSNYFAEFVLFCILK